MKVIVYICIGLSVLYIASIIYNLCFSIYIKCSKKIKVYEKELMDKTINSHTNIYLRVGESSKEVNNPIFILPRIGECIQYNGIRYCIKDIIHHNKKGFKPYIELFCDEIN